MIASASTCPTTRPSRAPLTPLSRHSFPPYCTTLQPTAHAALPLTPSPACRLPPSPRRWLTIAHIFACTWFILGWYSRCNLYEETWVTRFWPDLPLASCDAPANASAYVPHVPPLDGSDVLPWQPNEALAAAQEEVPWTTMYVACFYWALATTSSLGYGHGPKAVTPVEFSMSICCQVIGACISAAIFGNIAQLIQKLDALGTRYKVQQDKINEFVQFHKIAPAFRKKLHAYNKLLFSVNRGFDVGQISGALPANLRQDLLLQMHQRLVRSVPLFANCDEAFIKSLVGILRPQATPRPPRAYPCTLIHTLPLLSGHRRVPRCAPP